MHKIGFEVALTPHGWRRDVTVGIDAAGVITSIEEGRRPGAQFRRGVAVPGLPNVHSHLFQRGIAGLTERAGDTDDSFWTWRDTMYRFLGRLSPDDVEAIAAQAAIEMAEAGFTTLGEFHYLHHDVDGRPYANIAEMAERVAAGVSEAGLRLVLLPCLYTYGGFGGVAPSEGQRRFVNDLDRFETLHQASRRVLAALPGAKIGAAPHSLRAVALDDLVRLAALHRGEPIHIHVSEQLREVDDCRRVHRATPVDLLADRVALDHGWCLIHATHADADERARIAAAGAVVGLCPITEANLGDGIFPADDFVARGGLFAVGSDSNVRIGAAAELSLLEYGQRLSRRARSVLAPRGGSVGRSLFDMALAGGARALGLEPLGIEVGCPADLVLLDAADPAFAGHHGDEVLDTWMFGPADRAISDVWIAGRHLVQNGRHIHRDLVVARFRHTMERLVAA